MKKIVFIILILLTTICKADITVSGDGERVIWENNNFEITFAASPVMSESTNYIWMPADGTAGQAIITDGSGVLGWTDPSTSFTHELLSVTHTDSLASAATAGDIVFSNATPKWDDLAIGASNEILRVSGGLPDWQATTFITALGTITTGTWNADTITVPFGGTGATTLTDGGILLGSGTGAITALGVATNGQIPIGDGATDPVLATITGSTGITVTNGAGSIALDVNDAGVNHSGLGDMPSSSNSDHDGRYFTETEINADFVPYSGATKLVNLTPQSIATTGAGTFSQVNVGNTTVSNSGISTSTGGFAGSLTATAVIVSGGGFTTTMGASGLTTNGTVTATNIGAFLATGAINFNSQNMTNVDIDSGTIDGITTLGLANSVDVGNVTMTMNGLTLDGTFTDGTASLTGGALTGLTNLQVDQININGQTISLATASLLIDTAGAAVLLQNNVDISLGYSNSGGGGNLRVQDQVGLTWTPNTAQAAQPGESGTFTAGDGAVGENGGDFTFNTGAAGAGGARQGNFTINTILSGDFIVNSTGIGIAALNVPVEMSSGLTVDISGSEYFDISSGLVAVNADGLNIDFSIFTNDNTRILTVDAGNNFIALGSVSGTLRYTKFSNDGALTQVGAATASFNDTTIETGVFYFKETTSPATKTDYGAIFTTSDNELFFKDGAGTDHLLHGDAFSNIWFASPSTVEVTISAEDTFTIIDSFTVVGHEDDLLNVVGNISTNTLTLSSIGVGEYEISYHGSITATGGADKSMLFAFGITLAIAKDITNVTDDLVTPIVITSVAHGLENGDMVEIVGVLGNTAANGSFYVAGKADDTFQIVALDNTATTGNGDYNEGSPTGDITIHYPGNMMIRRAVRGADLGAISATGVHILANSDVLKLYVANLDGTTNLTVASVSFEIARLGD